MFAKVFSQIFDSSIAEDYMVRHFFMDLLVLANRDGVVDMTASAISRRTNVPIEVVTSCLDKLLAIDEESRSDVEQGRRIVPLDTHREWGWRIVNYEAYRNIRDEEGRKAYFRDYKRMQRERQAKIQSQSDNHVLDIPQSSTPVNSRPSVSTYAEAEADTEVEARKNKSDTPPKKPVTLDLPEWLPRKEWGAFLEMRKKIRAPMTDEAKKLTLSTLLKLWKAGDDPAEVLNQSIEKAWRGVFALKGNGNGRSGSSEESVWASFDREQAKDDKNQTGDNGTVGTPRSNGKPEDTRLVGDVPGSLFGRTAG